MLIADQTGNEKEEEKKEEEKKKGTRLTRAVPARYYGSGVPQRMARRRLKPGSFTYPPASLAMASLKAGR